MHCVLWGAFWECLDPQWIECVCLYVKEECPYLGVVLNIKEILSNFFSDNCVMKGLLGDLSLMHRSRPKLGSDSLGFWNIIKTESNWNKIFYLDQLNFCLKITSNQTKPQTPLVKSISELWLNVTPCFALLAFPPSRAIGAALLALPVLLPVPGDPRHARHPPAQAAHLRWLLPLDTPRQWLARHSPVHVPMHTLRFLKAPGIRVPDLRTVIVIHQGVLHASHEEAPPSAVSTVLNIVNW